MTLRLDVLLTILGEGRSSRLYRSLVYEKQTARAASAFYHRPFWPPRARLIVGRIAHAANPDAAAGQRRTASRGARLRGRRPGGCEAAPAPLPRRSPRPW
mgnify:CR=1 FL=1